MVDVHPLGELISIERVYLPQSLLIIEFYLLVGECVHL